MRYLLSFLLIFALSQSLSAQVWKMDSAVQGKNYQDNCYYSLTNEKLSKTSDNSVWDLAFYVSASGQFSFSAAVLANSVMGDVNPYSMLVYNIHRNGAYWDSVSMADTMGMTGPLWNSETSYDIGAFNQNADTNNLFDFGWGVYNSSNHNLYGDSIYLIKKGPIYYKFIVDSLEGANSAWSFRIADIHDTNTTVVTINDSGQYSNKLFAYYDIEKDNILDLEPEIQEWDLNFSKTAPEISFQGQTVHYPLEMVLANRNVEIAKLENFVPDSLVQDSINYTALENNYSKIGWQWRKPGTNDTVGNLSYLVKPMSDTNKIYQVVMNGISGVAEGKVYFQYREFLNTESVKQIHSDVAEYTLFPNPSSTGEAFLKLENRLDMDAQIQLQDITGRRVWNTSQKLHKGSQAFRLPLDELKMGTYILSITANNKVQLSEKLIVQ